MAYMSQENKASIATVVKKILIRYGMKGTLSVNNHSTLVLTLKEGKLDIIGNLKEVASKTRPWRATDVEGYVQVNDRWFHEHYSGKVKDFLTEVIAAMNKGNWDKSDIQSDYFNVGWYLSINVGRWNKPYQLIK